MHCSPFGHGLADQFVLAYSDIGRNRRDGCRDDETLLVESGFLIFSAASVTGPCDLPFMRFS